MRQITFALNFCRENFDKIKYAPRNYFLGLKIFFNVKNWKDYYLDCKHKIKEKFITYKLKNNLKIITRANTKDRDIFTEIFFGNEYFTNGLVLPEKAVVFDIGAHIGVFSVFIAEKAGKVFSFEPVPENFNLLKQNIELNQLQNKVFPFNFAVSDKKETKNFFLHSFNTGGNSFYRRAGKGMKKSIDVQITTLKEIFESNKLERCDLMKVDIEGGEYTLVFNLAEETLNKIKLIVIECHRFRKKSEPEELVAFLEKKGFEIKKKRKSYGMLLILAENKNNKIY